MKKILSFFAAMLVAVAVFADPVVLPATLDVSNVSFRSDGMPDFVLAEGDYAGTYFDMGAHDSSNDTLLYAEWDVTIEPIKYDIDVVVYNENSWRVQLYLLNQAGDTLKDLRYKGSSGQCGKYAIGSMDLKDLEAGNYKLRARAATAWSKMKLKEVIVKADYKGATVELPGKLLPAYAELSANASISNDAIAFKPSTAPDEYATWNVTFAKAGSFDVTIDMTASNGHNYGVALLSADGETEIGAVNEGGQKGDTGEKALGSIAVPAAGKYIVKLTNSIQWSEAVLNSITFEAPIVGEPKTIYCKVQQSWWTDGNAGVGIYAWGEGVDANAEWPGVRMTKVEGQPGVWSYDLPLQYTSVVFTRINPSDEGDLYWGAKTEDLVIPTDDNDLFTITSETAQWDGEGKKAQGSWSKFVPETPAKFYITGIDDNWEPNAIKSEEDSYVLHLAAGAYAMKITVDGTWATVKGFSNLTEVADGLSTVNDGFDNIHFTLDEAGDVTVTYTGEVFKLEGKFHVDAAEGCDWDNIGWLGDGSVEQKFGSQFKVCVGDPAPSSVVNIQTSFGAETGIYVTFPSAAFGEISLPEGKYAIQGAGMLLYVSAFVDKETEVSVVCDNKEIVFTVYNDKGLDPTTAVSNTTVVEKTVKMIENGQLIIIRNGEKFNAQGQVIR